MDKNYDYKKSEEKIYRSWEESGVFTPPNGRTLDKDRETFTVIMPPPNANDPLHVGHAMFITIEDILVRFHRMLGEAALWLPGTDHAGIETQFVFEKKLAKQGKSRFDFDRETLYKMIWDYVQENSEIAIDQMKKLGASADWSRKKFTLDPKIVKSVTETFLEFNKRDLVYKAKRLVNFCTRCGTAYSELEVEYEERSDKIYTIDYGNGVKVATTRPETLLGDVAVAVNPGDKRYAGLIGQELELPLTGRVIPVIGDETVEMDFGTGAVKVTPAHDKNDWEMAERAGMNLMEICNLYTMIGENGKMNEKAGRYQGLSVNEAREKVLEDLGDKVVDVKDIAHNVGTCYRCHRVIEPLPRSQFFVRVRKMADKALEALDRGEVVIIGAGHDKILRNWLENLKDWNISRQIVWGIKIPAWNKDGDYKIQIESPGEGWLPETDTFDTWFSSGQWPFVTLQNSKEGDFEKYYPTSVMETAYDILPFWVMRMLMLGIEMTGQVPFKTVYLHGLVRDEKGQKMSKSKGNVVNPLGLSEKYGTDALRMALVMSTAPGIDSNTGESKVRGMRNFANKIWNAGRFVKDFAEFHVEESNKVNSDLTMKKTLPISRSAASGNINGEMSGIKMEVTRLLKEHKPGLAAEYVYGKFWHWFCDEVIEQAKLGKVEPVNLTKVFKEFLLLLHPFVPFVTEAIWQEMYSKDGWLIGQRWPI